MSWSQLRILLRKWVNVRTAVLGEKLVVYLRDVTDRKHLECELKSRERELTQFGRINGSIRQIIRNLMSGKSCEEIKQMVCERLAATDLCELTWISERNLASDQVGHRAAVGEYDDISDLVEGHTDDDAAESPEYTAMQMSTAPIIQQFVDDESEPESMRRKETPHKLQSSSTVPLRYGSTSYGTLGVCTIRSDAFSEREQEILETLGMVTGFALNATYQRNLLLSDMVVELTLRVTDADAFFVAVSAQFDCELVLEGIVPVDEESLLYYIQVNDTDLDDVLALTEDQSGVDARRVVYETPDDREGLIEVKVSGYSPVLMLVKRGATIRTAKCNRGTGRIVAELAPGRDILEIVKSVSKVFPKSKLISKKECERSVETAQQFRNPLHERLTDRQREVLWTAYCGGYFESPRDSTAEELAEALDISSPTFHYHFRSGQKTLLNGFFDESVGSN